MVCGLIVFANVLVCTLSVHGFCLARYVGYGTRVFPPINTVNERYTTMKPTVPHSQSDQIRLTHPLVGQTKAKLNSKQFQIVCLLISNDSFNHNFLLVP